MKPAAGFALIESLLALVMLSIGLLGLGQLQVPLWVAGCELHTTASAYALAENLLETAAHPWLGAAGTQLPRTPARPPVRAEVPRYHSPPAGAAGYPLAADAALIGYHPSAQSYRSPASPLTPAIKF